MSDHNEHTCPECSSFLHYSCKLDAAVELAYGVKYSKPTPPAMSRDVEVLRELGDLSADLLAESSDGTVLEALRGRASRHRAALTAAIVALEALERQGVIVATGGPAEDSKVERIRALEDVIQLECSNARCCVNQGTPTAVLGPLGRMERVVDPHKSWCRDPEHTGVCISDLSEVDRGE